MTISMTIPIKNHDYLITQNILYHKALGIDSFVIYLHNSTDNSEKILNELSKDIKILVRKVTDPVFKDAVFRTEMAFIARDELKADWVISNDADEFWYVEGKKIKDVFKSSKSNIIYSKRYNMIPYVEYPDKYVSPPESFKYAVTSPIKIDKLKPFCEITPVEYMIKTNAGKAAARTEGLKGIGHGSHEIYSHYEGTILDDRLTILHYPYSTKERFLKESTDKVKSVLSDKSLSNSQDWHVRVIQYMLENGRLENFTDGLFPDNFLMASLIEKRIVSELTMVYDFFHS